MARVGIYVWFDLPLWPLVVTAQLQNNCGNDEEAENENKSVYPASFQRR